MGQINAHLRMKLGPMAAKPGFLLLFVTILAVCDAFNLDTNVPLVKEGRFDSYFGFSVTQHQVYRHRTGTTEHR